MCDFALELASCDSFATRRSLCHLVTRRFHPLLHHHHISTSLETQDEVAKGVIVLRHRHHLHDGLDEQDHRCRTSWQRPPNSSCDLATDSSLGSQRQDGPRRTFQFSSGGSIVPVLVFARRCSRRTGPHTSAQAFSGYNTVHQLHFRFFAWRLFFASLVDQHAFDSHNSVHPGAS